jgi:hypothetical protein
MVMGMNLDGPIYLQRNGMLTKERNRVLDIGPQTIYFASNEQIREFVTNQGGATAPQDRLEKEIARLIHFSTPRAGERTTMLSEITDLTNIEYDSIDVCPGLRNTEILDLNFDPLPERMRGRYDVVFNFGTTEHISTSGIVSRLSTTPSRLTARRTISCRRAAIWTTAIIATHRCFSGSSHKQTVIKLNVSP